MKFDDLDTKMRQFETAHDLCVLPGLFIVARIDGRGFTRLTKEVLACDGALRKAGQSVKEATNVLMRLSKAEENELLFRQGINFNDVPNWQKRGIGLWWETFEKSGSNPKTGQPTKALRRRVQVELDLPMREAYDALIRDRLREAIAAS